MPSDGSQTHTLHTLEAVLVARRDLRPEGSYTVQLLEDVELNQRKIMEEAFELCLELGRADIDHDRVTSEAADLVFHLLVGVMGAGASLDGVLARLEERLP